MYMIKAILFDMDGVLIDADQLHFSALNEALVAMNLAPIPWYQHESIYKGLPTTRKLEILAKDNVLSLNLMSEVARIKQQVTLEMIDRHVIIDQEKVALLRDLKQNYKICVCSNAKRQSVEKMLLSSGLIKHCSFFLGNEDVLNQKPAPDVYLKAIEMLGVSSKDTLIVEDSEVGRQAAQLSGAHVVKVKDPSEVNYYRISTAIKRIQTPHIVIPAAGQGKRFSDAGYLYPKPLIQVEGSPMIELVMNNFRGLGEPVIILQKKHCEQYCADTVVQQLQPGTQVVMVDGLTEGAACTVLAASSIIDDERELILVNSDQFLECNLSAFLASARKANADGAILTFRAVDKKWSYAAIASDGYVSRVAEKEVISPFATVGVYYFKQGRDFVRAAKQMIAKNIRVNNEFYVCPVFNELIALGGRVICHEIENYQMHGLGTPDDLEAFLKRPAKTTTIIELDANERVPSLPLDNFGEESFTQ
jgi:HAD superfamily hydrolase (TIGR01509 family)